MSAVRSFNCVITHNIVRSISVKLRTSLVLTSILSALLLLPGCTTDPVYQESSVLVTTANLPPLAAAEGHYELWFSYPDDDGGKRTAAAHGDAEFVSLGTFVVAQDGTLQGVNGGLATFAIPEGYNANLLIDAILTVEPPGDTDSDPEGRLLAGTFAGTTSRGVANLTIGGFDAFGLAFDSVNLNGSAQLMTPSTATTDDEAQGIWFLGFGFGAGLELRPHPINLENELWTYEAWLTRTQNGATEYISLGTFDNPAAADANGAGPNAGPDAVPFAVPGEDFVAGTLRTLNDGTYGVVVALQPIGTNVQRPFFPLLSFDAIPLGFETNVQFALRVAAATPTVEIEVER